MTAPLRVAAATSVDPQGLTMIADPAPVLPERSDAGLPRRAAADGADPQVGPVGPLDATFRLHSTPGARFTLYLDVDGHRVEGTAWNRFGGLDAGRQPAWDPGGDGADFSDAELGLVQEVWARVAEDYASFAIDVTTEEPAEAALERTSRSDRRYGVRALITPSAAARATLCGTCGGVAYLDVFASLDPGLRISWIFADALGQDAKTIADATSHEAAHQFGLEHDGRGDRLYYTGHGAWAPLMGSPYGNPVTQFSDGDYSGATNTEDDVAILARVLGTRADEADDVPLGEGVGVIGSADDTDVYALGTCRGAVRITASPASLGANLDIGLTLLDDTGATHATADPAVRRRSRSKAEGLDASLEFDGAARDWSLRIDGVGHRSWFSGYSDYGSIGGYRISRLGDCREPAADPVPDDPTGPTVTSSSRVRSETRLRVPTRVRAGARPRAVIRVRREIDGALRPASGSVTIRVAGRDRRVVIRQGRRVLRLPRLARTGRVTVSAVYAGDRATRGSASRLRIRVLPRR